LTAASSQLFALSLPASFHGLRLDVGSVLNLGIGGLLVQPTKLVPFPAGVIPPGANLPIEALAVELGPLGNFVSFTNTVVVTVF